MQAVYDRAKVLKLLVLDVDGVLTDGKLYLSDSGEEIKAFNTLDGHGLKMLKASGVDVAIITGRKSRLVEIRAGNLGIAHLYQGVEDKLSAFRELIGKLGLQPQQVAFMGDDLVDLPAMRRAGLALTVPAAPALVKQNAHYVSERSGGDGAVREVCELIMQAHGTFDAQVAPYLE
ncbi:MAG: 3-deoxy-manno-octulosonate-8-phosphatase KdsC [Chitinivorax sp.]|jgi:3-deoxy-D-manno-octulosonate 8-phosphate phosphatase (KDO 8-P phosphatase)